MSFVLPGHMHETNAFLSFLWAAHNLFPVMFLYWLLYFKDWTWIYYDDIGIPQWT